MDSQDSCLPYKTFLQNITLIKKFSDEINDSWELLGDTNEDYKAYLRKKIIKSVNCSKKFENESENLAKIFVFEYHVTYSISYEIPLLCFNVWNSDGKMLTMEESWKLFNKNYIQKNMYSVLTQQDHPVLQMPFLTLHPCKTVELFGNFSSKSKNPVTSWLSSVGPAINLYLNNEYEKLTTNPTP